jgi:hypothetical protein
MLGWLCSYETLSAALQLMSACPRHVAVRPVAWDLLAAFRARKGRGMGLMQGRCWHAGFSKRMALLLSDLPAGCFEAEYWQQGCDWSHTRVAQLGTSWQRALTRLQHVLELRRTHLHGRST